MNNYSITFVSLRAGTVYTVNIGGGTGVAIPLKGGAQPFTTQEDDSDDMFTPIRTQTGYIRIVDDGKDANGTAWDWKNILPATDTSRPVTLTDGNGNVHWQGFMQSQNFGGVLYGNPQEREFPVQCALTILEGTDINYQHTAIENFAYLLQRIVNAIDVESGGTETDGVITANGSIHINNIYVQGGADAQEWLMKRIDWQNFVSEDGDGNLIARYNLYQCLEDMCRFWGWTARTHGQDLYLTCADDSSEQSWLTLTRANLDTMAAGTAAGTTGGSFTTLDYDQLTDIFASTKQNDYRQRGANKATVKADGNKAADEVLLIKEPAANYMLNQGWQSLITEDDKTVRFTNNVLSLNYPTFIGSAVSGAASFNLADYKTTNSTYEGITVVNANSYDRVIMIKSAYSAGVVKASLETVYEHCFSHDFLELDAKIFQNTIEYDDKNDSTGIGNAQMYVRIGIGKTRASAMWLAGDDVWSSTPTDIAVEIGTTKDFLRFKIPATGGTSLRRYIFVNEPLTGRLFVDFLGSNDIKEHNSSRNFQILNPTIKLYQDQLFLLMLGRFSYIDTTDFKAPANYREYNSANANNVRNEWNDDCIYATNNDMSFGYGVIINADGSYMWHVGYGNIQEIPEQHLADRVTAYWASAKRKLEVELRTDQITEPSPQNRVTIDSTTGYPIAMSCEWRDDVTKLTIMEL